jgi:hypothetical protein
MLDKNTKGGNNKRRGNNSGGRPYLRIQIPYQLEFWIQAQKFAAFVLGISTL